MAHILIMPRQGNTVESCIVVNWKVKEGDEVTAETAVCEVETDKASFEVSAGEAGTVLKLLCNAGDDVPVLSPIAVIGKVGESWEVEQGTGNREQVTVSSEQGVVNSEQGIGNREQGTARPDQDTIHLNTDGSSFFVSPRARNLAEKEALPLDTARGTGPEGRIIERDVISALENRPALTAAAKAAGATEVPQQGTGIGGRVTAGDLAQPRRQPSLLSAAESMLDSEGAVTEAPVKGIRKIISDKMLKSLAETAQFTLNACAPVSRLQEIRSRIKSQEGLSADLGLSKITVNDLVLFAVSRVLPLYPFMNAHKNGDSIKTFERVHLGVAVDTPRGLMVPVIRNANFLSLTRISSESKRLAAACQNGSAKPEELTGSTFTVTNLGSLGITNFTPVLNTPEVAILGVCGIEMKPVLSDAPDADCCGYRFEPHIGFSLTINHQVVDGAPASRFLKTLCESIKDIDLLLAAG